MSTSGYFNAMNDLRLKPRMLRSLILDKLPDEKRPSPSPWDLAAVLSQVKTHGLLSERNPSPEQGTNPKVMEEWRVAVDQWVDRLISLVSSNMPDKCWAGTCLLGVTCGSCTSQRFLASYSLWFQKLLSNVQPPSSINFVKVASYASLADLLTRLASFPNVKKDATSLAGKLVQPILNVLNEDGTEAVWEGATDLLCAVITSFPASVQRHYDNVEAALVSKIMLSKGNSNMSKKFAYCLSLLPKVRGDEDSWSLLFHKILKSIHILLNDAFQGLEEEGRSSKIMKLLDLPEKEPIPPLWGKLMSDESGLLGNMLPGRLIPLVSILMHCCCMMINNPYPVQVAIPIHHLLALVGTVLHIDGSVDGSLVPFTTALHQEFLCAELPILHLDSLDLLITLIRGVRSQLLPYAVNIARLLTEYFRKAMLSTIRAKIYFIMETLLISLGVGMALYLAEGIISNGFADLDNRPGNGALPSSLHSSKSVTESLQQNSRKKRKHASVSSVEQPNGVNVGAEALDGKMLPPLSVKIAALKALKALLTVGGSLRSEAWRLDVDSLLINVATDACDAWWGCKGKLPNLRDEPPVSEADFQLASLEALLASLLSPAQVRPPYLSQGLTLFRRGKQETGTQLAAFCAHALLALEVLIHPRSLPLVDAPIKRSSALDEGFHHRHQNPNIPSFSRGGYGSINDTDDEDEELYNSYLRQEPPINNDDAAIAMTNREDTLMGSVEEPIPENNVEEGSRGGPVAGEAQQEMQGGDVGMASSDGKANVGTSRGPDMDSTAAVSTEDMGRDFRGSTNFIPGDISSYETDRGNGAMLPSAGSNIGKDTVNSSEGLGAASKNPLPSYDSDSTSINSLPDIVDADPDTDDQELESDQ